MKILAKIYWFRVALGAIAGVISTLIPLVMQSATGKTLIEQMRETNTLLNGITIALLVYLVSYWIMKSKLVSKVEKPTKIMTMGIFIYFFAWLVVWVLLTTLIIGPVAVT
ncbi:MAG: hypothetical protein GX638_14470 [Crenarchaeota archaeon]|nr:hypothetical protein [Thermoproteota archaeon]